MYAICSLANALVYSPLAPFRRLTVTLTLRACHHQRGCRRTVLA